jgi:GNAT superfamily N-acetyltransferase
VTTTRTEAVAWRRAQQAAACDELARWDHGAVLRTPSAPTYWDCNFVRVESAAPGLDAPALMAAADELLAGMEHRKIEVEDEAAGARLRPAFAAAGWHTERLAVMLRTGPPPPAPAGVDEVPLAATRDLRAEWYVHGASDAEAMHRLAAEQEPIGARLGLRALVIRDDGRPIAFATLAPGDGAVEIDLLYVTPAHRGRGLGASLVHAALAAGGAERAWIEADDEDRPRRLYERLGFATVWRRHAFTRVPAAVS